MSKSTSNMPGQIEVHLLPQLVSPERFRGAAVAVFDVLRATTTICHALAAGAVEVLPCLEVEQARAIAASFPPGECLLGGERGGLLIDGFDCGNSPEEYTTALCGGKRLVFTTTNGTVALAAASQAAQVFVGCLNNAAALASTLARASRVHLLCAGTEGHVTSEDAYAAGCIVADLLRNDPGFKLNDEAQLALALARSSPALDAFLESRGGRNLVDLNLKRDIEVAARRDTFSFVPKVHWDDAGQAHVTT